jgi:hypothetical protein
LWANVTRSLKKNSKSSITPSKVFLASPTAGSGENSYWTMTYRGRLVAITQAIALVSDIKNCRHDPRLLGQIKFNEGGKVNEKKLYKND